jgi:hypothetical protein
MTAMTNAEMLSRGLKIAAKKRKMKANQIEEVKWDDDARRYASIGYSMLIARDYLTGFSKRKVLHSPHHLRLLGAT